MSLLFALIVKPIAAALSMQLGLVDHFLAAPIASGNDTSTAPSPILPWVGSALGFVIVALIGGIMVRRSRRRNLQD